MYTSSAFKDSEKGFSLIELILVIAIMGIISGVIISVINPARVEERTRDGMRISNIQRVVEAIDAYYAVEGHYPSERTDIVESAYMASWPDDRPVPGDVYHYDYDSFHNYYTVHIESGHEFDFLVYRSTRGVILRCPQWPTNLDNCEDI